MTKRETRKSVVDGTLAGVAMGALVLACSNAPAAAPVKTVDSGAADSGPTLPADTTVATAPYPVCSPLEQGAFVFDGSGAFPLPATTSCASSGAPTTGPADTHCGGQAPQPVNGASCDAIDAGATSDDAGAVADAGAPGPCEENGGDYGATMYGTEADDDDCKYHVSYTATPICENKGTYFVVTANYLTRTGADGGPAPLTGASTYAELCLSNTHVGPQADGRPPSGNQEVVEGPPGTYTVGPVVFDAPGDWTVRFHFNEFCCDVVPNSPHGHAAFHVTVP
jgi:hypothetical protein